MTVVGHHRIGSCIVSENRRQLFEPVEGLASAMLKIIAFTRTAQKCAPNTTGNAVVEEDVLERSGAYVTGSWLLLERVVQQPLKFTWI
tara:strand:- start:1070 stop:1333 length:264 start_codon:yes stop_codon:yes gene_type:complete